MIVTLLFGSLVAFAQPAAESGESYDTGSELEVLKQRIEQMEHRYSQLNVDKKNKADAKTLISYDEDLEISIDQTVESATVYGADLIIAGTIHGNAITYGGDIEILETAHIEGDVVSIGGKISRYEGSTVGGEEIDIEENEIYTTPDEEVNWLELIYRRIVSFLSLVATGILVVGLLPKRVSHVAKWMSEYPIQSMLWGGVFLPTVAIAAFLFAMTIVGLPIAFLLVALAGFASLLGFVGLCQLLGDRLPTKSPLHARWFAFLAGCAFVVSADFFPMGIPLLIVASLFGFGASLRTWFGSE